ncbi:MAG TPA: adenylate/guanylate cyclase domain-containing protein [Gemmatimonadaceae bacterium]|nr:adenylate/guanylate cyclase domain-containing protein [Gemmatimonadaceae bacterium]
MPLRLLNTSSEQAFDLPTGGTLVVGRSPASDIPLVDPTISRRHAEIRCEPDVVHVRDLASSNGTFVNGTRVDDATVREGDVVTFGTVGFRLARGPADSLLATADATIHQQRSREDPSPLIATVFGRPLASMDQTAESESTPPSTERKLALLLDVSKGLSRAIGVDALLDAIAGFTFRTMDVDRVAIELLDERGEHTLTVARDRHGSLEGRTVPKSIARTVVRDKVAVLTHNAPEDERFGGQSIVMQSVRSAMCAPLIGTDDRVLGLLYVDNLTATQRFGDEDLEFLLAFSNIAAVAIENGVLAERSRREATVRSNFERFFAPRLAATIAGSSGDVAPGGEKREVAVLFGDIRGFTALSESMPPGEVASILSEYFREMVDVVFRHHGTLDKFIGDAVMAQWGAPIGAPDDADRAMAAALDMIREMRLLNERWRAAGRPSLQIGIGLSFGESFAGFIGSERRLEYTVIGDTVNVASRLCARARGGEILLTEPMRRALSHPPALVERGTMELRGKAQPVPVYSVMP